MFELLYKYLILYKEATIPGIGVFYINRQPASLDFANKVFISPATTIAFANETAGMDDRFYTFISKEQQIEEKVAIHRFNDFAHHLRQQLIATHVVHFPRVGTLTNSTTGKLQFQPEATLQNYFVPVVAEKIIRPEAEHNILVGDTSRTNVEMQEMLAPAQKSKDYWWFFAIILAIIGIATIVYYYLHNESF